MNTPTLQWFNGGLFDGGDVLPLTVKEIALVESVSRLDWSQVEPAIFGTLFERGLDPSKRSQLGAHYTDREAILRRGVQSLSSVNSSRRGRPAVAGLP